MSGFEMSRGVAMDNQPEPRRGPVVVGFDGSPGAMAAARWAVSEALLRHVDLHVVHVWQYPGLAFPKDSPQAPPPDSLPTDLQERLREVLADRPRARVRCSTVEKTPAEGLLEAAATADLLVVGRRRHHSLDGLALGSVSRRCAAHAPCPVVTVPPLPDRPEPAPSE